MNLYTVNYVDGFGSTRSANAVGVAWEIHSGGSLIFYEDLSKSKVSKIFAPGRWETVSKVIETSEEPRFLQE